MKKGGGKFKGTQFERDMAKALSLWISSGERDDLITRTDTSGGRFTFVSKGNPGDLCSSHPLAYSFFEKVIVECKFWKKLDFLEFALGKGELYKAVEKTMKQANELKKVGMVIAKQNHQPPIVICNQLTVLDNNCKGGHCFFWEYFVGRLDLLIDLVPFEFFLPDCETFVRRKQDEHYIT